MKNLGAQHILSMYSYCTTKYPLVLFIQEGDIISLVKKRQDGWCKGILHRYSPLHSWIAS
jgi:hypothetical protein